MQPSLSRRSFGLSLFGLGLTGLPALPRAAQAASSPSMASPVMTSDVPPPTLEILKWAPATRRALQTLMDAHGHYAEGYDPTQRPYAVIDWDESAIAGNVQETLFHYMLDHFSFLLPAAQFQHLLDTGMGETPLPAPFRNMAGHTISFSGLRQDILEDYQALAAHYGHRPHPLPREELMEDAALLAFRARMALYHQALRAAQGEEAAQKMLVRLLAGQTIQDGVALTRAANEDALGQSIGQSTWKSPASRAGRTGPVSVTITQGLRLTPEMADLFQILQEQGIDPVICTSSLEDSVAIFATSAEYGYNLPREHILGARLAHHKGVYSASEDSSSPFPFGAGKTALLRAHMAHRKKPPLLVFAGEDSSADLLSAFPETPLCCLINRKYPAAMQPFLQKALNQRGTVTPRYVLQGRDENTGEWRPDEASIFLGETTPRLP